MNLSQLQTFCTVCECLSFTEAATKLCISQPAVSRQIAAMESEIGTSLFERTHSTIVLTPAGKYLYQQLPAMVELLTETLQETKRIGNGETGRLRVGLLEDQSLDACISKALKQLQHANIYLQIQRYDFRSLEPALMEGKIDVAISIRQGQHTFPDCLYRVYAKESMCYAVHADSLPEKMKTISMEKIHALDSKYPLLIPSLDSFRTAQLPELTELSRLSEYRGQEYDFSSISPMVAAGLAATVANESHILSLDRNVCMIPVSEITPVQKCLFWSSDNKNPVINALVDQLPECRP